MHMLLLTADQHWQYL